LREWDKIGDEFGLGIGTGMRERTGWAIYHYFCYFVLRCFSMASTSLFLRLEFPAILILCRVSEG
jgi:hypothetical protein